MEQVIVKPPDTDLGSLGTPRGIKLTRFDFKHRVFSVGGAYLSASRDGTAMLNVNLGDVDASMPSRSVIEEFGIAPGDHDYELLALAVQALKHVKYVAPGDEIPTEIIDGTASWNFEEHHHAAARNRLLIALASWASGSDLAEPTPAEMAAALEKSTVRQHLKTGLADAARAMKSDDSEAALKALESIGREYAYIEALREYYAWIFRLPADIKLCMSLLKDDRQSLESVMRAQQLITPPLKRYRDMFVRADRLSTDMPAALSQVERVVAFIRTSRDNLHHETMLWAEPQTFWREAELTSADRARSAVNQLYVFLAQNFLETRAW